MKIEQLNSNDHAGLRVKPIEDYAYLTEVTFAPLLLPEFALACAEFPIIFINQPDSGTTQPVAMFSLKRGKNAFVENGRWTAGYLPATIRQAPFKLLSAKEEGASDLYLGIDTESALVSETEGERLFDDDGRETLYLQQRKSELTDFAKHSEMTAAFVALLKERELLQERTLSFEDNQGQGGAVKGLLIVDEERLKSIPAEDFADLRNRGVLSVIYAHLISLNRTRKLASTAADS
jgi:hypothetical protein